MAEKKILTLELTDPAVQLITDKLNALRGSYFRNQPEQVQLLQEELKEYLSEEEYTKLSEAIASGHSELNKTIFIIKENHS
jgi:hypothetical protein